MCIVCVYVCMCVCVFFEIKKNRGVFYKIKRIFILHLRVQKSF